MNEFVSHYFGWFFRFFNGIYNLLANKFVISFGGFTVSLWHIIIAITLFNIIIAVFVRSGGGGKVD